MLNHYQDKHNVTTNCQSAVAVTNSDTLRFSLHKLRTLHVIHHPRVP